MKKIVSLVLIFMFVSLCGCVAKTATRVPGHKTHPDTAEVAADTIDVKSVYLTEDDYKQAAEELGVDIATIKAVVEIEAGASHQGFWAEGKPVINFSLSLFRNNARKRGVNLAKYQKTHHEVFNGASRSKYGSQQAAVQARLDGARSINDSAAIESTFWGMFQIGGFNWKRLGCSSPQEFAEMMSRSEHDQLELFVRFVKAGNLEKKLQNKDWAGFARAYNGASYAKRGYHTKLANAYAKHSKK